MMPDKKLEAHEYAKLFPLATSCELDEMSLDIKKRGLLNPIIMLDGLILDGRNRYDACRLAGVAPSFTQYTGTDPLGDVLSWNLHRRNLSVGQRAAVALELKPLYEKLASERQKQAEGKPRGEKSVVANLPEQSRSRDQAAAAVGISGRTVQDAETIRRESPETFEKVKAGEITVNAAKAIIRERSEPKESPQAQEEKKYLEKQTSKKTGKGIEIAMEAINVLRRIPSKDPLRDAGFNEVVKWIRFNRNGEKA